MWWLDTTAKYVSPACVSERSYLANHVVFFVAYLKANAKGQALWKPCLGTDLDDILPLASGSQCNRWDESGQRLWQFTCGSLKWTYAKLDSFVPRCLLVSSKLALPLNLRWPSPLVSSATYPVMKRLQSNRSALKGATFTQEADWLTSSFRRQRTTKSYFTSLVELKR